MHTFSLERYIADRKVSSAKQDLTWAGMIEEDQRVIAEVSWVGDDALLVKEVDRASRTGHVVLFEGGERQGKVVRQLGKDGEEGDDGWIDHVSCRDSQPDGAHEQGQNVRPLKGYLLDGYFDIVPNSDGFNHLAFYSPPNNSEPLWLTSGDWEVTSIAGVDADKGLV